MAESGVEVSVIPIELSTSNKEAFWQLYESLLEVQRPSNWDDRREYRDGLGGLSQVGQRNVTNYETLSIQLQLNKLMELLEESINQTDDPAFVDVLDIAAVAGLMKKWGSRRALNAADQNQMDKIRHLLSPDLPTIKRDSLALPPSLGETIASNFIEPLENCLAGRTSQKYRTGTNGRLRPRPDQFQTVPLSPDCRMGIN